MVHKELGLSSPHPGHERTLVARVPITDGCFHSEQGRGAEPKDLIKKEEPEGKSKKPQACADLNPCPQAVADQDKGPALAHVASRGCC